MKGVAVFSSFVFALSVVAVPDAATDASATSATQSSASTAALIAAAPGMVGSYNVTDAIVKSVNRTYLITLGISCCLT
jgi:hypothetical protein